MTDFSWLQNCAIDKGDRFISCIRINHVFKVFVIKRNTFTVFKPDSASVGDNYCFTADTSFRDGGLLLLRAG